VFLTPPNIGGFFGANTLTPSGKAADGTYNAGYGYVNMIPGMPGYVETPRSGQIVAKIVF
jgi:hypothetical protein